jgi:hypothetical protein
MKLKKKVKKKLWKEVSPHVDGGASSYERRSHGI